MSIENEVKSAILMIAGKPDLPDQLKCETVLEDIGFNTIMCRNMEQELRDIVSRHVLGINIKTGSVTPKSTVCQCIKLVQAIAV